MYCKQIKICKSCLEVVYILIFISEGKNLIWGIFEDINIYFLIIYKPKENYSFKTRSNSKLGKLGA